MIDRFRMDLWMDGWMDMSCYYGPIMSDTWMDWGEMVEWLMVLWPFALYICFPLTAGGSVTLSWIRRVKTATS